MIFTNLIQTNLRTQTLGKNIEYYQRLESTNEEAWELIKSEESTHGMIVITDHQFKGKGRGTNSWFMSPSKGLAMSIILQKSLSLHDAGLIPLAVGVSVAKALENRGATPSLKWPKDIFIRGKKVGGILCESKISGSETSAMVVGIGVNINETNQDFPDALSNMATSLNLETSHVHQRELVCAIIATFFERCMYNLGNIQSEWLNYCNHLNEKVTFKHGHESLSGIFKNINEDGHAEIEIDGNLSVYPSIILD